VTGAAADDVVSADSVRVDEPFHEPPPGEQPDEPSTPTTTEPRTSKQAGLGTRNHLQFMSS
jgi:hypothetical protein